MNPRDPLDARRRVFAEPLYRIPRHRRQLTPTEERVLREQFAVRPASVRAGNIIPGVLEVALRAVAFFVVTVIAGTLLAWVLAGGPAAPPVTPRVMWLRGLCCALALQAACAVAYFLGGRDL